MDLVHDLQDVLRCHLCDLPDPPLYCQLCETNLCKTCAGEHLLDEFKEHRVVPIKQKWHPIFPQCPTHSTKQSELYCKNCCNPICTQCFSSGEHDQHEKVDIFKTQTDLQSQLQTLEKIIYPRHKKAVSVIKNLKDSIKKRSRETKASIKENGDVWHREIDTVIEKLQSEVDDCISKQLGVLEREEEKIESKIGGMLNIIMDLKKLENSRDVRVVLEYQAKITEFSTLPKRFKVTIPNFEARETYIKREVSFQFGNLHYISFTMERLSSAFESREVPLKFNPPLFSKSKPKPFYIHDVGKAGDQRLYAATNKK